MKLDIGTATAKEGWTSVDLFTLADICADMGDLPLPDGSVEAIRCSHALEHVGWREVPSVLTEWRRVLQPGGTLWIMVPTLDWCCRFWATHEDDAWGMQILFGNQERPGQAHRCGFTAASLVALVEGAGFEVAAVDHVWSHAQTCLVLDAFVA